MKIFGFFYRIKIYFLIIIIKKDVCLLLLIDFSLDKLSNYSDYFLQKKNQIIFFFNFILCN